MIENIKAVNFWVSVVSEYLSSNWLSILILVGITFWIWKTSNKTKNINDIRWKKAFWFMLVLTIGLNIYFLYEAYALKTNPMSTSQQIDRP